MQEERGGVDLHGAAEQAVENPHIPEGQEERVNGSVIPNHMFKDNSGESNTITRYQSQPCEVQGHKMADGAVSQPSCTTTDTHERQSNDAVGVFS